MTPAASAGVLMALAVVAGVELARQVSRAQEER